MIILSHRGFKLPNKTIESSLQSIRHHLKNKNGVEIDINFSKDKKIFFFHDSNLKRITNNKDVRYFKDIKLVNILDLKINNNTFCTWEQLIKLIEKYNPKLIALHFKGELQSEKNIKKLIKNIQNNPKIIQKILIFDLKIKTAKTIKKEIPTINLALSIAHPFDIKRFNTYTKKTLYPISTAIKNKNIFNWVWLDEWDRSNENNTKKSLYNKKIFKLLKKNSIKIALVTPELHSTSPGLYANEKHQDNSTPKKYKKRLEEIIKLKPDAICTDNTNLFN